MNLFQIVFAIAALATMNANAEHCSAQVVHSMCGSGRMVLDYDLKTGHFELNDGDVNCWNMDRGVSGEMKRIEAIYPYLENETFTLNGQINGGSLKFEGILMHDLSAKVASLKMKGFEGKPREYNLTCD
jgi:regulator of sigma D